MTPIIQTIRIATSNSTPTEVTAKVIGELAVHPALEVCLPEGGEVWVITHIRSGRRVGGNWAFDSESASIACVRALLALPVDWSAMAPSADDRRTFVAAVGAILALCGGFAFDSPLDHPVGSA